MSFFHGTTTEFVAENEQLCNVHVSSILPSFQIGFCTNVFFFVFSY